MSIHIRFANGGNPYVRYNMTTNEFTDELEKWQENYILTPESVFGSIYTYYAKEKTNA